MEDKVVGCFLEFGSPSLENVISKYAHDYHVTVLPLFFLRGKHYEADLKVRITETGVDLHLLPPLVEDECFIDFLQQTYQINGPLILSAHGSVHHEAKQSLNFMAARLASTNNVPWNAIMLAEENAEEKLVNFYEKYGNVTMLPLTFGEGKVFHELISLKSSSMDVHIQKPLSFNRNLERYIIKKMRTLEGR